MNTDTQTITRMLRGTPTESRTAAYAILNEVAAAGSWGGFPTHVTCEQIGEALELICLKAPVPNPLTRVLRGWQKAARRRKRQQAEAAYNLDLDR